MKEKNIVLFIFICLLMIFISSLFLIQAQTNKPETKKEVKETISQLVNDAHEYGTLALVRNGDIFYTQGFGYANKAEGLKNSNDILYPIASLQKNMTAVIIAQLIREKKLTYETTLEEFYPDLEHNQDITVRDLINHTSGYVMPEVPSSNLLTTEKEQLENAIETSIYQDNHDYAYSNGNYSLLAGIISQIEKKSYEASLKERILTPLDMNNTYLWDEIPKNEHVPEEYSYTDSVDYNLEHSVYSENLMSSLLGAGNVYASAEDVAMFELSLDNDTLLTSEEYFDLFLVDKDTPLMRSGNISSDGVKGGYSSYVYGDLNNQNIVIFLSNQLSSDFPSQLLEDVYQQLLLF